MNFSCRHIPVHKERLRLCRRSTVMIGGCRDNHTIDRKHGIVIRGCYWAGEENHNKTDAIIALSLESGKPWKLVTQIVESGSPDFPVFEYFYLFDIWWVTAQHHRIKIKFGEHVSDVIVVGKC